jgi:hypothetical protein
MSGSEVAMPGSAARAASLREEAAEVGGAAAGVAAAGVVHGVMRMEIRVRNQAGRGRGGDLVVVGLG